ncbi:hypothetical protein AAH991_13160 [Microbispora sp. ZYX-F-249]|uniref:Uncharacterized protein n=1 Tax=Microbispora maris TaxID=3144104 RepID=A0ABV0APF0_9ACTN
MPRGDDIPRIVIDETSFNFGDRRPDEVEIALDDFNDQVEELRCRGWTPWKPPMFEATTCTQSMELHEYLQAGPNAQINRDTRLRFWGLLDKCREWDAADAECDEVAIGADPSATMAMSVAYALSMSLRRRAVACLVFPLSPRSGFAEVRARIVTGRLFFFAFHRALAPFWRYVYLLEDVAESEFFELVEAAFPNLLFHPDLTFRRLKGTYQELRDQVIEHLGALNDHFLSVHREAGGMPDRIAAAFRSLGLAGISPDSPNTHRNRKAMAQREVSYQGQIYLCEWHSKLGPTAGRIHFAFGGPLNDKILIGLFVDHLET